MADTTTATGLNQIPKWKIALPAGGLVVGFAAGYAIKKCWGCATGWGFGLGFLCAIPLGMDVVKITQASMKQKPAEAGTGNAAANLNPKTVAIIADLKTLIGSDPKKNADFDKHKADIQKSIDGLTDPEKSAFLEVLTATKNSGASQDAETAVSGILAKMETITSKYTQPVMDSLNQKMGAIEKQFGINVG